MSARVRVRRDGERTVAVKVPARTGDDERLGHEATVLAAAAHPGVVELVGLHERDGQVELVTTWVGNRSLADVAPLPPAAAASVVASLATTVADLHDLGIVHGRLDPTHVLLDERGRPVLCGFADAGPLGERRGDEGAVRRAADDVGGLGAILTSVLGEVPTDGFIPDRRFRARRGTQQLHRSLLVLADRATIDDLSSRPSARSLAASIHNLAPESATLPALDDDEQTHAPAAPTTHPSQTAEVDTLAAQLDRLRATAAAPPAPRARRRGSRSAAAFVLAAAVGIGITVAATSGATDDGALAPVTAPIDDAGRASGAPREPSLTAIPTTTSPTNAGPTIEHDGRRYSVGEPGDLVAVGDWRCDGTPTAVVLRPDTGDVFVFDAWAEAGGDVLARPVTRLQAGARLVDPAPEGCAPLRAALVDGTLVTVPLPEDP